MNGRRLAALMFTDMVGYSALAHANELLARELVNEQRLIVREALARFGGIEHDTAGDGFFIEFGSAVDALECAVSIQSLLFDRNRSASEERKIQVRVGIHLGDIVTQDGNVFGNGVNVAARIEPFARAGGICISQQIFDQVDGKVSGLTYKKLGHQKLKNIASGAVIYAVILPWIPARKQNFSDTKNKLSRLPFFENMSSVLGALVFAACLACLGTAFFGSHLMTGSLEQASTHLASSSRTPAALDTTDLTDDLSTGWSYQLAPDQNAPLSSQTPSESKWKDFDTKNNWKYSEELRGKFWLQKSATISTAYKTPAIVLGLIPDSHRVFLNGKFIGGSDKLSDLAFYAFDREVLNASGENKILIEVQARASLNPGLSVLSRVGAFAGEFQKARAAVAENQHQFGLLRNMYFSFAIFIFVVSLAYAIFRRSSRSYFYYSFILLLGAIQLAYFSPLVAVSFDYSFVRFLKVVGLLLIPMVLVSSFLSSLGQRKLEFWNNALAAISMTVTAAFLLKLSGDTVSFLEGFNAALLAGLVYTVSALAFFAYQLFTNVRKKGPKLEILSLIALHALFECFAFIALASSLKRGLSMYLLTESLRTSAVVLTLATPFLFALLVTLITVIDYIRQTHLAKNQKLRNEFALSVLHLIHDSNNRTVASIELHEKLTAFTRATRSTLYSWSDNGGEAGTLRILNAVGSKFAQGDLSVVSLEAQPVLRHVLAYKTAVLIPNIHTDPRFSNVSEASVRPTSYVTGSCMVLPLRSMGQTLGLITFADKADGSAFTEQEFAIAIELASTLALLLASGGHKPTATVTPLASARAI